MSQCLTGHRAVSTRTLTVWTPRSIPGRLDGGVAGALYSPPPPRASASSGPARSQMTEEPVAALWTLWPPPPPPEGAVGPLPLVAGSSQAASAGPSMSAAASGPGAPHASWPLWAEERGLVSSEASPGTQAPVGAVQGWGQEGRSPPLRLVGLCTSFQSSAPESGGLCFSTTTNPCRRLFPRPGPLSPAGPEVSAGRWGSHSSSSVDP